MRVLTALLTAYTLETGAAELMTITRAAAYHLTVHVCMTKRLLQKRHCQEQHNPAST